MHIANEENRGYTKIKDACRVFNFDFRNKTVLDIGSSTGGFTEFALKHGANKVIAIEKGTNQMKSPLRFDKRIELHEKTDIFNVRAKDNHHQNQVQDKTQQKTTISSNPDVVMADVSFVSLKDILSYAKKYLADKNTEFLVMLKPQFEAKPSELINGVIKNSKIRRNIIKNFEFWLRQNGFIILAKHDNDLKGKNGNEERFYLLRIAE